MSKKYLTLNIGAATVELAEYEASSKGALTLVNYGTAHLAAPLDGGNADTILSPAILEIVREKGIKPGPVAVSISGQMAFQRFAAIPMAGGSEKFEQMVRYEIEQNIPFPIDEMVCDRQIVGDTPDGDKSVMIVAAKVDQVESITGALSAVGFTVELVDVASLALVNLLHRAVGASATDPLPCSVILDLGAKTTSLVIAEGDRIYNRAIPVAGNAITKEISTALGCTPEEAEQFKTERGYVSLGGVTEDEDEAADRISKVCRAVLTRLNAEISRSINFYRSQQGGSAPVRLYLTGGTALLPQIGDFFSEALGIEVDFLNPTETIKVGPKVDFAALESDAAFIASTAGLALHAAGQVPFAINLLPPSLVKDRAERARIPFVIGAGLALVAALALVMMSVNRQAAVVEESRDKMETRAAGLSRDDKLVQASATALASEEAKTAAFAKLIESRVSMLRRINAVCKAIEGHAGMWIDKWDASGVTIRYWSDKERGGAGKTASESVAGAIGANDTNVIDRASVKITSMSEIGKNAEVKQFTVEFKSK